ncbi:sugar transporter SWEET1 [Diachasma alloeum]|uniref:sugar transporter SWEET1 n=1 Tax=Diachasma alloeum TaxID=454923 RepID=UPI0007382F4E|nr:sugar transporter SWEET1 [Diachasma alloeum]XP_015113186.1 sugar transporter SWEET1 [Diachasma alloeum]
MVSTAAKDLLATSASICTALQFLAGTLVCRKFIKNGTTGDASALAFITCLMSCSFWLRYGQMIDDFFVVCVNLFGTLLQFLYIAIFALYSVKKTLILKQFVGAILFISGVYIYSIVHTDRTEATKHVGLLSCSLTILFFASPLTMLVHVIREKNADSLPFPVIVASLVVSCQWFIYGTLLQDPFMEIPNFMGCILSAFQLSLFVIYPGKKQNAAHFI